ncbi:MAG: histidine phosphatase family protein [Chlamydiota bacterium]
MKKLVFATIFFNYSLFAANPLPPHPSQAEFKRELGIKVIDSKKDKLQGKTCKIYLVQHGSTEWSEMKRLQGSSHVPLSEKGKDEVQKLAEKVSALGITAIYSSPLQSSIETAEILKSKIPLPVVAVDDLRGEHHGAFEGLSKEQYLKKARFQLHYFLPAEEEIFFSCGKGGESVADVGRRAVPAIKKIASEHLGESVVIVVHSSVSKLLNFFAGKYKPEETIGLAHGEMMQIEADATTVYVAKAKL